MKKYEIMYILNPTLDDKSIKNITNNINNIFKEGKILDFKGPELKTLAYSIKKFSQGFYVNFFVYANNEMIKEFHRISNIQEDIIRFVVVKISEEKEENIND
ncbi:30S ribosomal protein S6 [Texas Phoenix palm phytoplasma]|uniref:Small ribosomal subunit protein bS6 n=1 Tax=Texas Phoenix palm phytoplasma TaxID=176709 RepID=A0ABS5BKD9_9MOLU|nr:30S ribosomal protein S6 [Texas Phoenix palm phytoplasma]MBP3059232.1 30S ribosomal protein S6 [Texas Phoenix palm phytoplasma]